MSSPTPRMIEKQARPASANMILFVLLGPLLVAGVFQLAKAGTGITAKGDNTYPESAVVQTAIWANNSGRIYPSLDQSPYTPAPYGPLFYVGLTALARAGNLQFDGLLVAARMVTLSVFLLIVLAAYFWERRHMRRPLALLAPAIILAQIDFVDWNVTVRPDLVALGLTVAAFLLMTEKPISWRTVILAGALCGFAGAVKQSYVALPCAAVLWLLWSRRFRWAAVFAGSTLLAGGTVLAVLLARHEPVLQEMLLARYSPTSILGGVQLVKSDFLHYPLQIALLGLGMLGLKWMPRDDDGSHQFLVFYFILAWLMGFYTAMAPGANVNAFLEGWVVTAMLSSFAINPLLEHWSELHVTGRGLVLVMWISLALVALEGWRVVLSLPPASSKALARLVQGRRVLTDFPYVAAHSQDPELLDPSVNHYLELAKRWSSQPVQRELENHEFDYVIVGLNAGAPRSWRGLTLISKSILRKIDAEYRLACSSDRFAVYVPAGHSDAFVSERQSWAEAGCHALEQRAFSASSPPTFY